MTQADYKLIRQEVRKLIRLEVRKNEWVCVEGASVTGEEHSKPDSSRDHRGNLMWLQFSWVLKAMLYFGFRSWLTLAIAEIGVKLASKQDLLIPVGSGSACSHRWVAPFL